MNEKHLYVTIDTEMDANVHWKKMWPPEYSSIYEGIPKIFRPLWNKYNVHPIYFLSPEILYDERCCQIFREEIENGAIIGAHLHPEYIEPEMRVEEGRQTKPSEFPCSAYEKDIEKAKLEGLTTLIESKLGVKPLWYRAARFGADSDSFDILEELGYKFDSSATPGIDWSDRGGINYSQSSSEPYQIEGTNLIEYPISICGKRWGIFGKLLPDSWLFYKWLRPTNMTYIEMKSVIREFEKNSANEFVMMFHSMEVMIDKTPYVRNKFMQKYYLWRLDKLLAFCVNNEISM